MAASAASHKARPVTVQLLYEGHPFAVFPLEDESEAGRENEIEPATSSNPRASLAHKNCSERRLFEGLLTTGGTSMPEWFADEWPAKPMGPWFE